MLPISQRADDAIVGFEIGSAANYQATEQRPTWPQGDSGVTIGIGSDLGYMTGLEFDESWRPLLPHADADRLASVVGLRGQAAHAALPSVRDIVVPLSVARRYYDDVEIPQTVARCEAALPNCASLHPDSFGALVSLVLNRGADFISPTDRRREMRTIKADMAAGDFADIPVQIRAMARLWTAPNGQPLPGMRGLLARRFAEAQLFEDGLRQQLAAIAAGGTA